MKQGTIKFSMAREIERLCLNMQDEAEFYGKQRHRKSIQLGQSYTFGSKTFTDKSDKFKEAYEYLIELPKKILGEDYGYNGIHINFYYPSEMPTVHNSMLGWHTDDEPEIDDTVDVFAISIGNEAIFDTRVNGKEESFILCDRDWVQFSGKLEHRVRKYEDDDCIRISVTYRKHKEVRQTTTVKTFMSNMYPCRIEVDGNIYKCAEALYQACKCKNPEEAEQFVGIDGYTAKKLGKTVELTDDWNTQRITVMREVLKLKFEQNPHLMKALLKTKPNELVEINTWGDTFWGICNGKGENHLGKLLMELRDSIPEPEKKYYAGIGSRKTPLPIRKFMKHIAGVMEERGYTLRSGGAVGADMAFQCGIKDHDNSEIFTVDNTEIKDFAKESVLKFHPKPSALKDYAFHLMARNCYQIMGYNGNSLVERVICWTEDGCESHETRTIETGGTGQAISIASSNGIKVENLGNPETLERLLKEFDYTL